MELNKLYNMDCLIGMQEIPSGSVDLIICDPPYGTIKGIGKSTYQFNKDTTWDVVIPTDRLFDQYERVDYGTKYANQLSRIFTRSGCFLC